MYLKWPKLKIPSVKTTQPTPLLVKICAVFLFQQYHFVWPKAGFYVHPGFDFSPQYSSYCCWQVSAATWQKGIRPNLWSWPNYSSFAGIFKWICELVGGHVFQVSNAFLKFGNIYSISCLKTLIEAAIESKSFSLILKVGTFK